MVMWIYNNYNLRLLLITPAVGNVFITMWSNSNDACLAGRSGYHQLKPLSSPCLLNMKSMQTKYVYFMPLIMNLLLCGLFCNHILSLLIQYRIRLSPPFKADFIRMAFALWLVHFGHLYEIRLTNWSISVACAKVGFLIGYETNRWTILLTT